MGQAAQRYLAGVTARETDDEAKNALLRKIRSWAVEQDDQDLRAVAARASVRFLNARRDLEDTDATGEVPLACFRCGILSCVGAVRRDEAVISAARAASERYTELVGRLKPRFTEGQRFSTTGLIVSFGSCFAIAEDPPFEFALRAIFHESRGTSEGSYEATQADMELHGTKGEAERYFTVPLWRGATTTHPGHDPGWEYFQRFAERWSFWCRWYDSLLKGHPLDWDLQREVALIPDGDWQKGPEHIAQLIEEIEARFLANTLAERIELAPSGRLTLVPQAFPEDRHLGLLIATVRDALDLATSGIRNELPEDAYQVRLLRRTFARYANDPQRIEMDFERARVSLIEDIAADAIPASAPNRDLVQALSDAAGTIRDSDPEIARNRERLNRIRLGQVSPEDAARIAEVAEQVAEISEGVLRDDLLEDRFRLPGVRRDAAVPDSVVPLGAAERNAALEAQAAQLRLYSRLTKVWLFLKENEGNVQLVGALFGIVGTIVTVIAVFV